jgi:chromosome segregation ATPase
VVRIENGENEMSDLKKQVKVVSRKAEDLASMIERHRLTAEKERSPAVPTKKRGFFAWFFGWSSDDSEDDNLEEVHYAGRSTLLEALQRERNNVEELETAVASLQQNNSAIAEQVHSRDLIISELNDRVAVFEEDKVVLKAALRQLRKEMNEDAPMTDKLVKDLKDARKEADRLNQEIESIIATHQQEIAELQQTINKKEETIQETESNLTMIGKYVDRLEERLGDFAVARRDVTDREQEHLKAEQVASESLQENESLRARVDELEKEHDELKQLFEELIYARTNLKNECNRLQKERDAVRMSKDRLKQNLDALSEQLQGLRQDNEYWQTRAQQAERELSATVSTSAQLKSQSAESDSNTEALQLQLEETVETQRQLENLVRDMEANSLELKKEIAALEQKQRATAEESQSAREELAEERFELQEALAAIAALEKEYSSILDALQEESRLTNVALEEAKRKACTLEDQVEIAAAREVEFLKAGAREVQLQKVTSQELERRKVVDGLPPPVPLSKETELKSSEKAPSDQLELIQDDVFHDGMQPPVPPPQEGKQIPGDDIFSESIQPPLPPSKEKHESASGNVYSDGAVKGAVPSNHMQTQSPQKEKDQISTESVPSDGAENVKSQQPAAEKETAFRKATSDGSERVNDSFEPPDEKLIQATDSVNVTTRADTLANRTSPPLPITVPPISSQQVNNATSLSLPPTRRVPFRSARKLFSKATGIHGLFTPPTHPRKATPPNQKGQTPRPASTATTPGTPAAGAARPDVVKHTLGGIRFPQRTPESKT